MTRKSRPAPSAAKRRRAFALAYVGNGFRGYDAAVTAGYSEKSARSTSSQLLSDPVVSKQIKELTDDYFGEQLASAKETLAHISSIARFDSRRLEDENGKPIRLGKLDAIAARAVKSVTYDPDTGNVTKYQVESRVPALQIMARYHRLIDAEVAPAKVEQTVAGVDLELARRIAFALARANSQTLPVIES